jgi:hypothetical protein
VLIWGWTQRRGAHGRIRDRRAVGGFAAVADVDAGQAGGGGGCKPDHGIGHREWQDLTPPLRDAGQARAVVGRGSPGARSSAGVRRGGRRGADVPGMGEVFPRDGVREGARRSFAEPPGVTLQRARRGARAFAGALRGVPAGQRAATVHKAPDPGRLRPAPSRPPSCSTRTRGRTSRPMRGALAKAPDRSRANRNRTAASGPSRRRPPRARGHAGSCPCATLPPARSPPGSRSPLSHRPRRRPRVPGL